MIVYRDVVERDIQQLERLVRNLTEYDVITTVQITCPDAGEDCCDNCVFYREYPNKISECFIAVDSRKTPAEQLVQVLEILAIFRSLL